MQMAFELILQREIQTRLLPESLRFSFDNIMITKYLHLIK
ncbi:MAG: hypothetical protein FD166_934 [Bacteroidetes bacterium]|jgi:hypothetical protein|nr:MAG: hypothetical protein FD166_934 [Bacteroidota bacterium]